MFGHLKTAADPTGCRLLSFLHLYPKMTWEDVSEIFMLPEGARLPAPSAGVVVPCCTVSCLVVLGSTEQLGWSMRRETRLWCGSGESQQVSTHSATGSPV